MNHENFISCTYQKGEDVADKTNRNQNRKIRFVDKITWNGKISPTSVADPGFHGERKPHTRVPHAPYICQCT